jgi:hypothetical protein
MEVVMMELRLYSVGSGHLHFCAHWASALRVVAGAAVEVVESAAAARASRVESAIRLNFILSGRRLIEEERVG